MRPIMLAAAGLLLSATLASAQADPTPAYQALEQQGFTVMQTLHEQNRVRIMARRGDEVRQLVYDSQTGKLLWDSLDPNRDRTQDHLYLQDQTRDQLRDWTKDQDRTMDQDKTMDQTQDQLRTRDPSTH